MKASALIPAALCAWMVALPAHAVPAAPGAPVPQKEIKVETLELDPAVKEVLAQDPTAVAEVYRVVAESYSRRQLPEKAVSLLATYVKNGGDNPSVIMQLANLYNQHGMHAASVSMYEDLVKKNEGKPQETGYAMTLLNLYRQDQRWKDAVALLQNRIKAEPKNPDPLVQLADVYRSQNDLPNAESNLKKAIALQAQPWYYQQLSQIYVQQKKESKAVSTLEEGAKKLPQNEVELKIAIADIYVKQGKKDKAIKLLKDLQATAKEEWRKQDLQRRISMIENPNQPQMPPMGMQPGMRGPMGPGGMPMGPGGPGGMPMGPGMQPGMRMQPPMPAQQPPAAQPAQPAPAKQ